MNIYTHSKYARNSHSELRGSRANYERSASGKCTRVEGVEMMGWREHRFRHVVRDSHLRWGNAMQCR